LSDIWNEIEKAKEECQKCKHKDSPCMDGRMRRILFKGKKEYCEGFSNDLLNSWNFLSFI